MSAAHRMQVRTGSRPAEWARFVADLERYGLLTGSGAGRAVARVEADVLAGTASAPTVDRPGPNRTTARPVRQVDAP